MEICSTLITWIINRVTLFIFKNHRVFLRLENLCFINVCILSSIQGEPCAWLRQSLEYKLLLLQTISSHFPFLLLYLYILLYFLFSSLLLLIPYCVVHHSIKTDPLCRKLHRAQWVVALLMVSQIKKIIIE